MSQHQMVRVLVYEGDEEWLRRTIPGRAVKGTLNVGPGMSIREVYLSDFTIPVNLPEGTLPPQEWAQRDGIEIMDPDGWRDGSSPPFDYPITRDEYDRRVALSTIRSLQEDVD